MSFFWKNFKACDFFC